MTARRLRAAVDVGGTFTDVVLCDPADGRLVSTKVPTTPNDWATGVLNGIHAALQAADAQTGDVHEVVHGSTTGTNALIERTGARVGLLTTAGFRDLLEIGRVQRPMAGLYDFMIDRPAPLVPRELCRVATERIAADGQVLTPLDENSVREAAAFFATHGIEAVAICFLFSYVNPEHERHAAEILRAALPAVDVSISSAICPEYREYERASTVVMNAYLAPVMRSYFDDFETRLQETIAPARLSIIQANGGSTSVATARDNAVTTVNSGPAGGVVAAAYYGRQHDRRRIVSVDMGGTSFDIGLVEDGTSRVTTEGAFQDLPVKIPIIDLHIIGAGGGSIAWVDAGGALNVGPQSAGSLPGPACYGRGGSTATVTDANVVLGRLNPGFFNGGRMQLDATAARAAVSGLATTLGLGVEETALGIIKVVNANMVKGIASVTIQRGIDIRDFSLLSFGGAGGVHAVALARDLNMAETIIPPLPGTFSALGLLVTETRHDYVRATPNANIETADAAALESEFLELEDKGLRELCDAGFDRNEITLQRYADLKVRGQTYELTLPLADNETLDHAGLQALKRAFTELYRQRYAFFFEGEAIEIVNLRVAALGQNPAVGLPKSREIVGNASNAVKARRPVYFEAVGFVVSSVFDRAGLAAGMHIAGPALIEEESSTTLLPPGERAEVTLDLGLVIRFDTENTS